MTGRTLGQYEFGELLGSGGMGEVYAARDTRLGRRVAVKVLGDRFASDPERRARFEREAKAIAALEHPNIVTVYAVEEIEGVLLLAMQLVDGASLADLLEPGGLALARFFDLAIPLADAVAAAHERGVTHRDLKPGNVIVSRDGRPMVLDFGLAKVTEAEPVSDETSQPTQHLTEEGAVLGTVSYMSPEQAEGKPVDARSDIFSLGVMLYEMATGELPFRGDTKISVISAIVKDAPRPVTAVRTSLPRHLGRIVRRALEKDVGRRYQSAVDLRNDLEDLRREIESGEHEAAAAASPVRVVSVGGEGGGAAAGKASGGASGREKLAWALVATLTVALAGFALASWLDSAPAEPRTLRIATGSRDGVYYPMGQGIARVVERELENVRVQVLETQGSYENVRMLDAGEIDLALMQNDVAFHSVKTDVTLGHRSTAVTGVAMLFEEVLQIIARESAGIDAITDFRGKVINLDLEGSGSRIATERLTEHFGIGLDEFTATFLSITEVEQPLIDGEIDATVWWRALPSPFARGLFQRGGFEIVPIQTELVAGLRASQPFLTEVTIPALTYPGQTEAVNSVAAKAMLVARADLDAELVYTIVEAMFRNIPDLIAAHPRAADLVPERAFRLEDGMAIDLHPGAARYWQSR